jgi:hypothetical protein
MGQAVQVGLGTNWQLINGTRPTHPHPHESLSQQPPAWPVIRLKGGVVELTAQVVLPAKVELAVKAQETYH